MSKNKKKKKVRRANPETLAKVRLGLSTLISNDACIRTGREWKGALTIIPITLALASVVLAILPTFVSRMNVQGSAIAFSAPVALYDQGLADFISDLVYDIEGNPRETPIELKIENGTFSLSDKATLCAGNAWYTVNRASTGTTAFEVFFNDTPLADDVFYTNLNAYKTPEGEPRDPEGKKTTPQASFLAFGKNSIRFLKKTDLSTNNIGALTGSYQFLNGTDFTAFAKTIKDADGNPLKPYQAAYVEKVRAFYTDVINKSYEPAKVAGTWQYTGIFAGIDLGLILLFGLITFLMTRGKKNPFRIYTFWETQKMAYWASFTPAVLSMVLGFWLTQYAFIFFMFTYGMRMMWMSMKSMRPVQQ